MGNHAPLVRRSIKNLHGRLAIRDRGGGGFNQRGEISNRISAAERLDILTENLIGRGNACKFLAWLLGHGGGSRLFIHSWYRRRQLGSAMASVAGYLRFSAEHIIVVQRRDHPDHFSCGLFRLLIVCVEMIFHVTERTSHSQGRSNELHGGYELIGRYAFQHLDVLVDFFRGLDMTSGRSGLRVAHAQGQERAQHKCTADRC